MTDPSALAICEKVCLGDDTNQLRVFVLSKKPNFIKDQRLQNEIQSLKSFFFLHVPLSSQSGGDHGYSQFRIE